MRCSASDKTEIIRLVEQSCDLPTRRTLEKTLAFPDRLLYRWYDRHQRGGPEALADLTVTAGPGLRIASQRPSAARLSTWRWSNPELGPRELAVRFTDEEKYFGLERLPSIGSWKAHDLIASPAYIVIKGGRRVQGQNHGASTRPPADRLPLYLKIMGWGWYYLSSSRAGRLLARFIVCLEALRDHESAGRDRHARSGIGGPQGLIRMTWSFTGRACCRTTARHTSQRISRCG